MYEHGWTWLRHWPGLGAIWASEGGPSLQSRRSLGRQGMRCLGQPAMGSLGQPGGDKNPVIRLEPIQNTESEFTWGRLLPSDNPLDYMNIFVNRAV